MEHNCSHLVKKWKEGVGQPCYHSEDHVPLHSGPLLHTAQGLQESPEGVGEL